MRLDNRMRMRAHALPFGAGYGHELLMIYLTLSDT